MSIPPIVHEIVDLIVGKRGGPRWRFVTGFIGWAGALAFAGWLVTTLLGFPSWGSILMAVALLLVPIASRLLDKGGLP